MATPNKPGLHVIVGLAAPKSAPPAFGPRPQAPITQKPTNAAPAADEDQHEASGQKASAEDAQVFDSTKGCAACDNFLPDQGACKVVEGQFNETTGCNLYFEPKGTEATEGSASDQAAQVAQPAGPEVQEGAV